MTGSVAEVLEFILLILRIDACALVYSAANTFLMYTSTFQGLIMVHP